MFDIKNQRILITGASAGLGAHFANTLACSGAKVVLGARRLDELKKQVSNIRAAGGDAIAVELDVTLRDSVSNFFEEAQREFGGVDTVINNAGVSSTKAAIDYTEKDWDLIVDTNLKGAWTVIQESAKYMIARDQEGKIINITSIASHRVANGISPYCAAKAGLSHLTRSMARELAKYRIRVNSLAPGYVITALNREILNSAAGERLKDRIPMRQFCLPEDLDGPLLFLCSNASRAMTGSEIVVDNGHLCMSL